MNRALKIILEKATADARDARLIEALDAIYTKMVVVPLQRAWTRGFTKGCNSEHTCDDCNETRAVSHYNHFGRQPCFDCRQRDRFMAEAD